METARQTVHGFWARGLGTVSFGADNQIVSWAISNGGPYDVAQHLSSPDAISGMDGNWPLAPNVADFIGMAHYGMQYSDPDFIWYAAAPGTWAGSFSSTYREKVSEVACQKVVLAHQKGALRHQTVALAHAPIPASLPLLIGGVAALGWIGWRRRARSA